MIRPTLEHVGGYVAALERGWSPDSNDPSAGLRTLGRVNAGRAAFLASLDDPAKKPPLVLPDGSVVARLPSIERWMWDGDFAGRIDLRWQPGTVELPPWCLGHIGYHVVPWRAGRGYAKAALAHMLTEARKLEMPYVELTTNPDNVASQHVILANGGVFVEKYTSGPERKHQDLHRYRITLA